MDREYAGHDLIPRVQWGCHVYCSSDFQVYLDLSNDSFISGRSVRSVIGTTCRVQLLCRVDHLDNASATQVPDTFALAATPTFAFSNAGYARDVCAWLCTGRRFALASTTIGAG